MNGKNLCEKLGQLEAIGYLCDMNLRKRIAQEVAHQLHRTIEREHPLQQLFWECTLRCNVHCRHCGSDCRREADVPDMPAEDFLHVLDSVARKCNPHEVFIIITGGEPLMRDDLEEVGAAIYKRGFPWGLVTNGFALTPERFRGLCEAGLHSVALSLDGLEENHNWMRGHKDSFRMVEQAIDLLVASGIRFDCVTCVNRRNYAELPAIRDFLIKKGVQEWRIYTVVPMGRAKNDPAMHLSPDEFRGTFDFIKQTRKEGRIKVSYGCEGYLGDYEGDVRDHFFHCQAGITAGSVMADGAIAACASIRSDYNQGNIYEDDFMDVWEHRYQPHRTFEWRRTGECKDCRHWRYCRGNGMHLRDNEGKNMLCHMKRLNESSPTKSND